MKKWSVKKISLVVIPVLCILPGIMIFKSVSGSKIVLKDQARDERIMLHNMKGEHACHCFPPMIATNPGFQITAITDTSASFRWVCDVAATYQVNYGTTNAKGTLFPATKPTTSYTDYTVTVKGLKPNTTYHAGPVSQAAGRSDLKKWLMSDNTKSDWTFTTKPKATGVQAPPPSFGKLSISDVKVSKTTTVEATITWKTNIPSTSQVEYGPTKALGLKSGENTDLTTEHYIQLFDLKPGATYYYKVTSRAEGKPAVSLSDLSLITEATEKFIAKGDDFFVDPNPSSEKVEFNYFVIQPATSITIDILSLSGKKMATLQAPSTALGSGWQRVAWNLKDHSGVPLINGLYLYVMKFTKDGQTQMFKRSQMMVRR
jgi:hypothetical protein